MRTICLLFLLFFLAIGCKKEEPKKAIPVKEIAKVRDYKSLAFDSLLLTTKDDKILTAFYRHYGFATVWFKRDERAKILQLLRDSAKEGLYPADYAVPQIEKFEKKIDKLDDAQLTTYDFILTAALQKYLWHLSNGKLNPKNLYGDYDLKPNAIKLNAVLMAGIMGDSLEGAIESVKQKHPIYSGLKRALLMLNDFPKDTFKAIVFTQKMVRNDSSSALINIKKRLIFWKDLAPQDSLTIVFDKKTFAAVKNFQRRNGLPSDGVIGKGTVDALNMNLSVRKHQVLANLERWRWFPHDFGKHYVLVNIPGYYLKIINGNDTVERKRIVVGKSNRKTPVLSSTFNNIVFNPTWTVPPTILKEDLVPDATKNRSYFAARNMTIYNSKGEVVDPEKWNPENPRAYRYVQAPSYHNSLGVVKFNFPNRYTVYLHDTNHRDYFVKSYRSLSSGCVRVEDPLPMAQYMLNDSVRWSRAKIDTLVASGKTTTIVLKQKIRLHQLYWTAWMEKDGILEFRPDIYDLDEALYQKLRK